MFKSFFSSSNAILFCFIVLLASCSKDEESTTPASFIEITRDGVTESLTVTKSKYSPIERGFTVEAKGKNQVFAFFISEPKSDNLIATDYNSNCNLKIDILSSDFVGSSFSTIENQSITLTTVTKSETSYLVQGEGTDIILTSAIFTEQNSIIEKISFSVNFEIPAIDTFDFLSFEINNVQYTYYGKKSNAFVDDYQSPNPSPDNVNLFLSGNILDDFSQYASLFEGFSIDINNITYPPVVGSRTGYSEGLRMYYTTSDNPDCFLSNYDLYNNGNNDITNYDACKFAITKVTQANEVFEIEGTFSGKITEDVNNSVLSIDNGTFKVTVKAL